MTPTYPLIPTPPARTPEMFVADYGRELLLWTLRTGVDTTLDDTQLVLALSAARAAVCGAFALDTTREALATTVTRLANADARRRAAVVAPAPVPTPAPDRPNLGPMARLTPVTPTRPPAPVGLRPTATPDFPLDF